MELPDKDCSYAIYDTTYKTKESKEEDLVVIWAPESVPLKSKMISASSKDVIQKLSGISMNYKQKAVEPKGPFDRRCTSPLKVTRYD
ncbi:hypothetical protein A6R68_09356 [Neotoma lepida]|uniref:ADF-H domain-containing protein n=1 Tax=Neotoma lepida TaxID=56216 RepID=A0A1A6G101_NEOLE|nr:hypothetical protein A6R68_09356 [Neotoma lepida]